MDLRSKLALYKEGMEKKSTASSAAVQGVTGSIQNAAGNSHAQNTSENTDNINAAGNSYARNASENTDNINAAGNDGYMNTAGNSTATGNAGAAGNVDKAVNSCVIKAASGGTGKDVDTLVPGIVQKNDYGSCYVIENRYSSAYLYGSCKLGDGAVISTCLLTALGGADCESVKADRLLYLDTETTGLSGGAGTLAFLVGVGYFEDDTYVVRQYFTRDYDEEAAMLTELQQLFSKFQGFVTFNGKAFDINLLQSRFISNRFKVSFRDKPNLDLLYPSRKVWGLKLESCRLSSLEENILGEFRTDDIPGAQIPSVFFKYLEDRDATDIKRVIRHNELDILSMVSLLTKLSAMLENPLAEADGGYELLGLGKILEVNGQIDNTLDCLEACTESEQYPIRLQAIRRLTDIYKRNGQYDQALTHWKSMEAGNSGLEFFHLVEMAKYYEHKAKDISAALSIVEKAVQNCLKAGIAGSKQFEDLRKRRDRLHKKLASKK